MQSKKIIVKHNLNGKRIKVEFNRRKLFKGIYSAIDSVIGQQGLQHDDFKTATKRTILSVAKKFYTEKVGNKKSENKVPSLQDVDLGTSNLGEGLNNIHNQELLNYPEQLNPFAPVLSKIRLNKNENAMLAKFLNAVRNAESLDKLNKIIDTALGKLTRINAPNKGLWSFADAVLFRILDTFPEGAQDIMHKLILKGATFDDELLQVDKRINKTHDQLQQDLQPQLHNQLTELRKVAENASIAGTVKDVEFDNRTFYMEFSKDSVVDVDKITSGTRKLGFDSGNLNLGGDIIKIGNSKVELKVEKDGKTNYLGVSNNAAVTITFQSSRGCLKVYLSHNLKDNNLVQVRVNNKQAWEEFKTEAAVKNCLLGGVSLEKAVKMGSFVRLGKLGGELSPEVKEKVKKISSGLELSHHSEEGKMPWIDKLLKGKKTTPLAR